MHAIWSYACEIVGRQCKPAMDVGSDVCLLMELALVQPNEGIHFYFGTSVRYYAAFVKSPFKNNLLVYGRIWQAMIKHS